MTALKSMTAWAVSVLLLSAAPAIADTAAVGSIAALQGTASVIRATSDQIEEATIGLPVYQQDIIESGSESRLKIEFNDDTVVMLGADGTLKITEYVYEPQEEKRSSLLSISRGVMRTVVNLFVPDSRFEVQTGTAVASVRGTEWVTEAESGNTNLVVFHGSVSVTSADPAISGETVLNEGEGTNVSAGQPPEGARIWSQDKVQSFRDRTFME